MAIDDEVDFSKMVYNMILFLQYDGGIDGDRR